jgi:serine/threonine protein kinase
MHECKPVCGTVRPPRLSSPQLLLHGCAHPSSDGTPKLTDFGLSVFSHPDHMLTSSAGSLCYLAPEIVKRVSCKGVVAASHPAIRAPFTHVPPPYLPPPPPPPGPPARC